MTHHNDDKNTQPEAWEYVLLIAILLLLIGLAGGIEQMNF